jgi:hypothetical protein
MKEQTWTAMDAADQLGCNLRVTGDHRIEVVTEEIGVTFTAEQSEQIALAVLGDRVKPTLLTLEGANIPPEIVARIVEQMKTGRAEWIRP